MPCTGYIWVTARLGRYLWLDLTGLDRAAQVGRRQWERVLEMVRRIRALDMEVRRHTSQASSFHLHSITGLPSESMEPSHARRFRGCSSGGQRFELLQARMRRLISCIQWLKLAAKPVGLVSAPRLMHASGGTHECVPLRQVCTTLGMLTPEQAAELRQAGLSAYNHNLDTSPEYYGQITTTRKYEVGPLELGTS